MSKLRPLKSGEVIRAIKKLGFTLIRQSGSHAVFRHPDGRWTTIPIHKGKDISKGVVRKILANLELTMEEFEKYL